jgi:toxin secretion/phage lysis holin
MDKTINALKIILAVVGSFLVSALGGADNLIILLLVLASLDMVFGAAKGAKNKKFSSSVFLWGIINKAIIFAIIALMVRVDLVLGKVGFLRNAFIIWFSLCEGASIIENSASLGIPWPEGLLGILIQVRKGFSINLSKIVQQIIDNYNLPKEKESEENG